MKKVIFKEKLEIVRNIIRESLSGNALLLYWCIHYCTPSPLKPLLIICGDTVIYSNYRCCDMAISIIYVYFCELFRSHWIAVWFISGLW